MISRTTCAMAAATAVLLLASCTQGTEWVDPSKVSFDPSPSEEAGQSASPVRPSAVHSTWKASQGRLELSCIDLSSRATYAITLPTPSTQQTITELEDLRKEAGITQKPSYVVVRVNTTGVSPDLQSNRTSDYGVLRMRWRGAGGRPVVSTDVNTVISQWVARIGTDDPVARKLQRTGEMLNPPFGPGITGEQVLATNAPITQVSDPTITLRTQQTAECSARS